MSRHDLSKTLPWMVDGTSYLLSTIEGLSDEQLAGPSALPNWTRAHVIGHVARNADALVRLATWARTGVENPMYPSPEARNAEIAETATRSPAALRSDVTETAGILAETLATLDDQAWHAEVRSAQGRAIPALELPWMRIREVWLHAVDLDAGARLADCPVEMLEILLGDVAGGLSNKDNCPAATLRSDEGPEAVLAGGDQVTVSGPLAGLVGWITGRSAGTDLTSSTGALPALPAWL